MKHSTRALILAGMLATGAIGAAPAALAQASAQAPAEQAKYEADRKAILAMAGNFHVNFDFRETVPWRADYDPIDAKVSGGFESVRVVEDTGSVIRLQHILVVSHEGEAFVVKHWRQDWTYEPASVLEYAGQGRWELKPVAEKDRAGAWSQTVWQTDDSPRYGGVGRWEHDLGVPRWTSAPSWRPLARRDAVRKPVYDRYLGINRHALTPTGWVHTQDNMKLGLKDGRETAIVQESVINSYDRDAGFQIDRADGYWGKTRGYWAAVRGLWDAAIARGAGVHVTEEAENGSVTGPALMGLADRIEKGEVTEAAAIAEARGVIDRAVK